MELKIVIIGAGPTGLTTALKLSESTKYNLFYKEFELNYLLSTYHLSEACDFRNNFKNTDLTSKNNYMQDSNQIFKSWPIKIFHF